MNKSRLAQNETMKEKDRREDNKRFFFKGGRDIKRKKKKKSAVNTVHNFLRIVKECETLDHQNKPCNSLRTMNRQVSDL